MDGFMIKNGVLHAEALDLRAIADAYGTPCYVYSRATLERHWRAFDEAFTGLDHQVCFAVKACSNIAVLNVLARLGSGFDIVSGGELERVLAAGGSAARTVFSGVGKSHAEIQAALTAGIQCFNVESQAELMRIAQIASTMGVRASVSLRVNPDVDALTHPYISTGLKQNKFGIPIAEAEALIFHAAGMAHLNLLGLDCHIGSQLVSAAPFVDALDRLLALVDRLAAQGVTITHLNLGGGLGVRYRGETPPLPAEYARALRERLSERNYRVLIEPGRAIAANAGILLTRVEYLKPSEERNFAIVDAGMNDLVRPSLYQAWHDIVPVQAREDVVAMPWDIVGPVCETGDFLGKERELALREGDLLAVRSAGAYGFSMSSNYNSRPRAAEVMVDGDRMHLIRERETPRSLFCDERLLPA
ncbi:MAG: diaminopimelate decarboxylase [Chromatiales bacterium]|jgi:diaminopimelate decarboxylase|nr:diaminopimelate decarboxylase [Chromatiales bacterium]